MTDALTALARLREGNDRFVSGQSRLDLTALPELRGALVDGQRPFAVILGCSDSRVPVELVFDQGLGDLFVVRVAGNVCTPSQIASVEFAAEQFGTRLVVVLGHTHCGAVKATISALRDPHSEHSVNLQSIVDRIGPAVMPWVNDGAEGSDNPVRANVRHAAGHLRDGSALIEDMISDQGLLIVGAEYALETGRVDFFDGLPDEAGP